MKQMNHNPIELLRAGEADLPAISALAGEIWRECYVEIISREQIEYMLQWMYDVATLRRELREEVRYEKVLVAGELAGFAAWGPATEPGLCKLHKLYLHQQVRSQGVGSAALRHVLTEAGKAGFAEMRLNVNKKNAAAIAAYQRHGFLVIQEIRADIGNGFVMDDFIMARQL